MRKRMMRILILSCLVGWMPVEATQVTVSAPTYDRWMYPFNGTPGARAVGATFGALGSQPDFDERDATVYLGFDTSSSFTPGLGSGNYQINAVRLVGTLVAGDFAYDPTYDLFTSYLASSNALYTADTDAGRPVELHGAGYADGMDFDTFGENGAFGVPGNRSVYPGSFIGGSWEDVSNNVDYIHEGAAGYDSNPFAVGATTLNPGDPVPAGTSFTFDVNLSDPFIVSFIAQGLNRGNLGFMVSSFHSASFGGPVAYPNWAFKENVVDAPFSLMIDASVVVPEPSAAGLLALGAAVLLAARRRKN